MSGNHRLDRLLRSHFLPPRPRGMEGEMADEYANSDKIRVTSPEKKCISEDLGRNIPQAYLTGETLDHGFPL